MNANRVPPLKSCWITSGTMPGTGTATPARKATSSETVMRILLRSQDLPWFLSVPTIYITSALPPAASIFSFSDLEKAWALTVSVFLISPSPRILR